MKSYSITSGQNIIPAGYIYVHMKMGVRWRAVQIGDAIPATQIRRVAAIREAFSKFGDVTVEWRDINEVVTYERMREVSRRPQK